MKIWIDGKLVPAEEARVSVMDHGLLYGDGCFEGIRIYNGRIFKLRSHLRRMWDSAREIRLDPPYSIDEVEQAIRDTVAANELVDGYIRLVFTRGVGTLGLHPFLCPVPTVFVIADTISLYPQELYDNGMKIIVAKRPRVPRECLDPQIKSLNYLNNILAKIEAIDADVLEALMLNVDGWVSECTGDNVFIVKDGAISTPPTDAGILNGITRQTVIAMLKDKGITVHERHIMPEELEGFEQCWLTGTAAEVTPVGQIGDYNFEVGALTRDVAESYEKLVRA